MISIMTDNTVCMTKKEAIALGVHIVPIMYVTNSQTNNEAYIESGGLDSAFLVKGGQTSSPNPTAFLNVYEKLIQGGNEVLCITLSSRLSGTYNNACTAQAELGEGRIRIVDSLSTAGGLYFMVRAACKMAAEGMALNDIADKIEAMRDKTSIAFTVDDVAQLRKSGRLGLVRQSVSVILNRKPLLLLKDGVLIADGMIRGKQMQIRSLLDRLPQNAESVLIHYIECQSEAQALLNAIKTQRPDIEAELKRLGRVLGLHVGTGMLGLAWVTK